MKNFFQRYWIIIAFALAAVSCTSKTVPEPEVLMDGVWIGSGDVFAHSSIAGVTTYIGPGAFPEKVEISLRP